MSETGNRISRAQPYQHDAFKREVRGRISRVNEETESAIDAQIKQWAEDYERLFASAEDSTALSDDEQIPPEEMRGYVDNYKKWFEPDVTTIEEKKRKLTKLKMVREGWKLNSDLLDKIIRYVENQLSGN